MNAQKSEYLTLPPELEAAIAHDLEQGKKHPLAVWDTEVIRRFDNPHDRATLLRPAFARDIEKIINLPAYNRYGRKTQVFSFTEDDDISRRSLHVQLVCRIARNIGRLLGLNTELIEAIALSHDLGHTPFGHVGEHCLSDIYHHRTNRYFNHNVQSVRTMDVLYPRNISLQTLDGALCHNGEFVCQQLSLGETQSFDDLDKLVSACETEKSVIKTLRPSTLEGCVVRISDMIAYLGKDRQDAMTLGIISSMDEFLDTPLGKTNASLINNIMVDIVTHSYGHNYLAMSKEIFEAIVATKKENYLRIYTKEGMVDNSSDAVKQMFEMLYEKLLEDFNNENKKSPLYRDHLLRLERVSKEISSEELYEKDVDRVVVDYLSSMTDDYFLSLFQYLFPSEVPAIVTRNYFCRS